MIHRKYLFLLRWLVCVFALHCYTALAQTAQPTLPRLCTDTNVAFLPATVGAASDVAFQQASSTLLKYANSPAVTFDSPAEDVGADYAYLGSKLKRLQPHSITGKVTQMLERAVLLHPTKLESLLLKSFTAAGVSSALPSLTEREKKRVLRFLGQQTKRSYPEKDFVSPLGKLGPSPFMAGAGDDISGIQGPLKAGLSAIKSTDAAGPCWAQKTLAELATIAKSSPITFGIKVDAFREVAMIFDTSVNRRKCSAVVISKDYVLSAAHCFTVNRTTTQLIEGVDTRFKILVPNGEKRASNTSRSTAGCGLNGIGNVAGSCDYLQGTIVGTPTFLTSTNMVTSSYVDTNGKTPTLKLPSPDIALLRVDFDGATPAVAQLRASDSLPNQSVSPTYLIGLTRAGYGLPSTATQAFLTIGYWLADTQPKIQNEKALLPHPLITDSKICSGDSGGPVYANVYVGQADEKREVVAIASAAFGNPSYVDECKKSAVEVVQLLTSKIVAEIAAEICKTTADTEYCRK